MPHIYLSSGLVSVSCQSQTGYSHLHPAFPLEWNTDISHKTRFLSSLSSSHWLFPPPHFCMTEVFTSLQHSIQREKNFVHWAQLPSLAYEVWSAFPIKENPWWCKSPSSGKEHLSEEPKPPLRTTQLVPHQKLAEHPTASALRASLSLTLQHDTCLSSQRLFGVRFSLARFSCPKHWHHQTQHAQD